MFLIILAALLKLAVWDRQDALVPGLDLQLCWSHSPVIQCIFSQNPNRIQVVTTAMNIIYNFQCYKVPLNS
jgi:hypothetical protein